MILFGVVELVAGWRGLMAVGKGACWGIGVLVGYSGRRLVGLETRLLLLLMGRRFNGME